MRQPVGASVINNYLFLKKLSSSKSSKKRLRLLRLATSDELFAIIESAYNLLKARFNLTPRQKKRLIPHLEVLRRLGRSRSDRGVRTLLQKGGGLGALPAILTPILIEAFRLINGK
jgi:hypothetical protein